jgi:hypothetical protein
MGVRVKKKARFHAGLQTNATQLIRYGDQAVLL